MVTHKKYKNKINKKSKRNNKRKNINITKRNIKINITKNIRNNIKNSNIKGGFRHENSIDFGDLSLQQYKLFYDNFNMAMCDSLKPQKPQKPLDINIGKFNDMKNCIVPYYNFKTSLDTNLNNESYLLYTEDNFPILLKRDETDPKIHTFKLNNNYTLSYKEVNKEEESVQEIIYDYIAYKLFLKTTFYKKYIFNDKLLYSTGYAHLYKISLFEDIMNFFYKYTDKNYYFTNYIKEFYSKLGNIYIFQRRINVCSVMSFLNLFIELQILLFNTESEFVAQEDINYGELDPELKRKIDSVFIFDDIIDSDNSAKKKKSIKQQQQKVDFYKKIKDHINSIALEFINSTIIEYLNLLLNNIGLTPEENKKLLTEPQYFAYIITLIIKNLNAQEIGKLNLKIKILNLIPVCISLIKKYILSKNENIFSKILYGCNYLNLSKNIILISKTIKNIELANGNEKDVDKLKKELEKEFDKLEKTIAQNIYNDYIYFIKLLMTFLLFVEDSIKVSKELFNINIMLNHISAVLSVYYIDLLSDDNNLMLFPISKAEHQNNYITLEDNNALVKLNGTYKFTDNTYNFEFVIIKSIHAIVTLPDNKNDSFPTCAETTLFNFYRYLLYNNESKNITKANIEKLNEAYPHNKLKDYFTEDLYEIDNNKQTDLLNKKFPIFVQLLVDVKGFEYARNGTHELKGNFENITRSVRLLLGEPADGSNKQSPEANTDKARLDVLMKKFNKDKYNYDEKQTFLIDDNINIFVDNSHSEMRYKNSANLYIILSALKEEHIMFEYYSLIHFTYHYIDITKFKKCIDYKIYHENIIVRITKNDELKTLIDLIESANSSYNYYNIHLKLDDINVTQDLKFKHIEFSFGTKLYEQSIFPNCISAKIYALSISSVIKAKMFPVCEDVLIYVNNSLEIGAFPECTNLTIFEFFGNMTTNESVIYTVVFPKLVKITLPFSRNTDYDNNDNKPTNKLENIIKQFKLEFYPLLHTKYKSGESIKDDILDDKKIPSGDIFVKYLEL